MEKPRPEPMTPTEIHAWVKIAVEAGWVGGGHATLAARSLLIRALLDNEAPGEPPVSWAAIDRALVTLGFEPATL